MVLPYKIFQLLKRHITVQQKVPMLKHGYIRNQHTHISEKKQTPSLPRFNRVKKIYLKTKYDVHYYRKFSIQLHLALLCSLQDAQVHSRTADRQTDTEIVT